jgi:hypothetical protein
MLNESRMSEIHGTISDHLDKHISNYKRIGGAESFANKVGSTVKKVTKEHGIPHEHATKLVNDYVEGELKEQTLDESRYPSGPHGDTMSADARDGYKEFNTILKSKGFTKDRSAKSSAQEDHVWNHPTHGEVCIHGWHGTGKGNRDYGGVKQVQGLFHRKPGEKFDGSQKHHFMSDPKEGTEDAKGMMTPKGVAVHKAHINQIKSYLNSIGSSTKTMKEWREENMKDNLTEAKPLPSWAKDVFDDAAKGDKKKPASASNEPSEFGSSPNNFKYKTMAPAPKSRTVSGSYGKRYETDPDTGEEVAKPQTDAKRRRGRPSTKDTAQGTTFKWDMPKGTWMNPKGAQTPKRGGRKVVFAKEDISEGTEALKGESKMNEYDGKRDTKFMQAKLSNAEPKPHVRGKTEMGFVPSIEDINNAKKTFQDAANMGGGDPFRGCRKVNEDVELDEAMTEFGAGAEMRAGADSGTNSPTAAKPVRKVGVLDKNGSHIRNYHEQDAPKAMAHAKQIGGTIKRVMEDVTDFELTVFKEGHEYLYAITFDGEVVSVGVNMTEGAVIAQATRFMQALDEDTQHATTQPDRIKDIIKSRVYK